MHFSIINKVERKWILDNILNSEFSDWKTFSGVSLKFYITGSLSETCYEKAISKYAALT